MDRAVFAIVATARHRDGHFEQHMYTWLRPKDREVFAIAATATFPDGHLQQPLHTPIRSMGRAVFAIVDTATFPRRHSGKPLRTPFRPMDRAVFATEPTARYVNDFQQHKLCKHLYPNGNRESETIGGLPNFHTWQQINIHIP